MTNNIEYLTINHPGGDSGTFGYEQWDLITGIDDGDADGGVHR